MARPLRLHVPGMLYHVIARGNNKQCIYVDTRDFESFLTLLGKGLERFSVQCLAYCLMHTHYHLLLKVGPHSVSRLMQHVNSAYCQQFNRRHERVGHVLQGRFISRMVEDGLYARVALRYLALNPVAANLVSEPELWPWSSFQETMRPPASPAWLSLTEVWAVFGAADEGTGRELFAEFVRAPSLDEYESGSAARLTRARPIRKPARRRAPGGCRAAARRTICGATIPGGHLQRRDGRGGAEPRGSSRPSPARIHIETDRSDLLAPSDNDRALGAARLAINVGVDDVDMQRTAALINARIWI
jgi:REP element-mobilizing transposase RayT